MQTSTPAPIRSLPNTVHHAAEIGDLKQLEQLVQRGIALGTYASVTLQQQESLMLLMPVHLAAETGQTAVIEVGMHPMQA